jgi:5-formyltetrahydrofolate cyclo-ligase
MVDPVTHQIRGPMSDRIPGTNDTASDDKAFLRRRMRTLRREHVEALPRSVLALMFSRPPGPVAERVPEGSLVGLYHAATHEVPTRPYASWLYEHGRKLALPWFADKDAPMTFREWENPFVNELVPGPYGVQQPSSDMPEVVPEVLFVPLLGFTSEGDRLGQGGGHYDRWLAAHPGTRAIGLAWDCQKLDAAPREPHDQLLEGVVTPTRFYERAVA